MPYEFRLDGGRDRAEGILQVRPPNATEWSNFCVSNFSTMESALVCQTLGYKYVQNSRVKFLNQITIKLNQ